ncbi:tyrosine lyase ThiH [Geoalkalibacter ferrihydriticus]|uniref:Thiamine biosynthesis protein ThiH n=2 Tax=Geoalkalibacter ferrihydriticus TaxID=392333 RepID=A0A0C2HF67_9BACT|nr:2-iminoacetate synthase ThiH [Geoalkalibacter ferrihydriticus]KIH75591.1 thiamine biosynthesis protein ThiH [Geoalkalibacter ferrihydriticus DSM 17813]SDL30443.1 tyrosine lyase ThiH [Geoalkalibacter ferrihydriticus]
MSFLQVLQQYDRPRVEAQIAAQTAADVERALNSERLHAEELLALLSPAAEPFIETMAQKAHRQTVQRFGRNILLYAPLYLSNECVNGCLYCGFSANNQVPRRTLSLDEIATEAQMLHDQGFRHILLVTGESPKAVDNAFIAAAARRIRHLFSSIAIEVYPMETAGYQEMIAAGVDGLTIYQETYDSDLYRQMHPFGKKRDFAFRLATPERGGAAGLRRMGIGSLLGLGDFRFEGFCTGLHALYLSRHFWRTQLTVSFPRIRPADGGFQPLHPVSDRHFVQLICALRLLLPDVGLVMSTRESAKLRDNLLPLGITQMSAGSCTAPGGYTDQDHSTRQFAIDDDRSPAEVCRLIRARGYEAVWKDWDAAFLERAAGQ